MHISQKLGYLTLTIAALAAPALASDDLETSQMVDQARLWQQKRRDDLAAEIWRKVLRFDPKHPEALARLGAMEPVPNKLPPPSGAPADMAPKQKPLAQAKLPASAPSRPRAAAPSTKPTSDSNMNFSSSLELAPAKPKP